MQKFLINYQSELSLTIIDMTFSRGWRFDFPSRLFHITKKIYVAPFEYH